MKHFKLFLPLTWHQRKCFSKGESSFLDMAGEDMDAFRTFRHFIAVLIDQKPQKRKKNKKQKNQSGEKKVVYN